ncbi:MAG: hypothetical protein JSU95_05290 [Betaproteobacteria bacterium]|nr:MAG: hypothetical protein JSU95_05290 [Betaproteobacteria bacterium]
MATRGLTWLAVAGIIFVLLPQTGAGLEIGRVTVNSKLGQPLDAIVRIFLAPGEELDSSCLSIANRQDFSNPEHALLGDAKLTLLGKHGPIQITTSTPVTNSAVSLGLHLQCDANRISVRPVNLYLQGHYSITSAPNKLAKINSDLPGTTITVKRGDSVYKLSRLIYPHEETAVANLAQAIILTNPALFPDGRGRPLQIGERLTIPDLRTVEAIVARSPSPVVATAEQPAPAPSSAATRQTAPLAPHAGATTAPAPEAAPVALSTRKIIASGELRLQLATGLDLSRTRGLTEQQRAALRRPVDSEVVAGPRADALPQIAALSSRADRIRQLQDGINDRLARLEAATTSLKNAFFQTRVQRAPPPAPARRPTATRTEPPKTPAAPPAKPVTRQQPRPPAKPAVVPRLSPAEPEPAGPPAWQSYGVFALLAVLAIAFVLLGRKFLTHRALVKQRTRIDAMLEQARAAATPLLGSEPAFEASGAAPEPRAGPPPAEPEVYEAAERVVSEDTEPEIFDPTKTMPFAHLPAAEEGPSSPSEQPPAQLRAEMDDAMDATRSMFSDVDRFITLGRIQNAISLLEFQIKREPTDRDSWIKLMAVYRSEGMDDDFERIYAGFREQFGEYLDF